MLQGADAADGADTPATENSGSGMENGVRLRSSAAGSQHGSTPSNKLVAGRLSPVRRRVVDANSPQEPDNMPKAVYDRLKTLSSMARAAEEQIRDLQVTLKDTLRDGRPPLLSETGSPATSWSGKRPSGSRTPRDKEFIVRSSTLTDLFAIRDICTIYHLAVVVLLIMVLKTVVHDLVAYDTVSLSFGIIWHSFGSFHRVITIWLVMMLAEIILYSVFTFWAQRRQTLDSGLKRCWDAGFLLALLLFYAAMLTLPLLRVVHYAMPFASSMTVLTESVRMVMKSHAFVRSNAPRALKDGACPGFSKYLYFMFAPTLIYRDSYPSTSTIRWRVVVCHVVEVVGCIFYLSFLLERYLLPLFQDFGRTPPVLLDVVSVLLSAVLPAGLSLLCCFYLQLHSWQNGWAEMLRFGDRMFYMDWWNQSNFAGFYRTWNVLVQDWLFTYVYKDVLLLGGSVVMAKLAVFGISAVVHEFIIGFTMRFFYPVLYVFFGVIGTLLAFVNSKSSAVGNIGLWFSLLLGSGILFGTYTIEHYARVNCAQIIDSSWDLFVPRSWSCVPLQNSTTSSLI